MAGDAVDSQLHSVPSYERLDERSKSHADKLVALEHRCAAMESKLDDIIETLSEAKGGWRTLLWVGGAAGAIGALVAKFVPWFG